MRIDAVIFDFDGTLADSEPNYYEADRLLMAEYGIDFTFEMKKEFIGRGNSGMMKTLHERYNLPGTVEDMIRRKNQLYLEIALKNTPIYPEMLAFIKMLVSECVPIAIASGTSSSILNRLVDHLDLRKYFDAVISSDDVGKSKPNPDIFLKAAEKLHSQPENCLVVEDSVFGIEAGLNAGMQVMAIPYLTDTPLDEAFFKSDILFQQGHAEFTAKKAMTWFESRYLQK